ncbi:MAG: class I adenylate-forming enzyme family protein, partial [Promethearchaeota archaeon]
PEVDFDPDNDIVALMYTGGTTGLPKGVMLTHRNLVSAVLSVLYNQPISVEERESMSGKRTMMAVAPMCHIQGYLTLCIVLRAAMMVLMLGRFDPGEILETIEDYKISTFGGLPVMYQMIINHPDFRRRDLSSITSSISGGAALAPELARIWHEVVGSEVGQGYGLTESAGMGNNLAPWMPRGIVAESVSVPIVDMDLKIVNPDTLDELPPGEVGEMLLRGPLIMKGYWKNPEATAKDLVDGWLRTGDLGKMDEDGYFYIEGRSKDMVKYKGYKVMPKEVEIKLMEHPAILEAGVVGVPDPNIGETIKAFIVLKKEDIGKVTEQEIIEWSKEKLAGYKWPRKVEFINSLPRTGVGKIKRRKLREMELEK